MRRSTEKQAKFENKAEMETSAQNNRSSNIISNIASLDNDTTVEVFKYLNYCRLAKTSLVSKRFSNLIRTRRHKLARLYVDNIGMIENDRDPTGIKIFDQEFSPEAYNEWVIRNGYSKQIPLETQIAGMQSTQYERKVYWLYGTVDYYYKDSKTSFRTKSVFDACIELSHENWPVFQHYIRLLTDPFVYICSMRLPRQNDALNLLAGAINPDCGRLQCKSLKICLEDNTQNHINWIKEHVRCYNFCIIGSPGSTYLHSNHDEEFLDFFMTGANCPSKIYVEYYDPCKAIVNFVQKFMELKGCDENKVVGFIGCQPLVNLGVLKRDYGDFVVQGDINKTSGISYLVFEFVNNDIGKKLRLSIKIYFDYQSIQFTLKIASL